ncbi:aminoglycoside phosphotransferase family protein [Candidatus Pacearchaeota archaeon]|nr:aminoglycoside phosphotransferase family protein [Candidatus Pacearchaeota archaeon]OIO41608.1 MAG: hypothetical protein AUJ63_05360 [Candidatus Pacearchaeota archaeon CG1_02_35_32]
MFKDKLDNNKFVLGDGKNYRTPKQLNLVGVKEQIENLGYKVIEIDQIFRNVHAKIEKNSQTYFLKLATTRDISERIRNEINWNLAIVTILETKSFKSFIVPRVYDFGEIMGNTFYICDFYKNNFLALKNPARLFSLKKYIPNIVDTNIFLLSLPKINFLRDQLEFFHKTSMFREFYNMDLKLVSDLPECKLGDLLEFEKNYFNELKTCVNHGDFVPWHMIKNGRNFVLIDGEHGSSRLPLGYDIAYFYHRVFTGAESPEIADTYIHLIYDRIHKNQKDTFRKYFYGCLANRIISGYWHCKNEDGKFDFHKLIKERFIKREIL